MPTELQIAANKLNARKCQGPKSAETRDITRFLPATPEEQSFVNSPIRHEWLSRRYCNAVRRGFAATLKQMREAQTLRARQSPVEIEPASPALAVNDVPEPDAIVPRAAAVIPAAIAVTTKPLNPKLDSFLIFPDPPPGEPPIPPENEKKRPTLGRIKSH